MAVRESQIAPEVIVEPTSGKVRESQVAPEVVVLPTTAKVRESQVAPEVIVLPTSAKVRESQVAPEVVILPTSVRVRESQVSVEVLILGAGFVKSAQAQASIVSSIHLVSGQALSYLNYIGYPNGQAQAKILVTDNNNSGNAQAYIGHFVSGLALGTILVKQARYGQAQALVGHLVQGQAQARILATTNQSANANALIYSPIVFAQAQADIKATSRISGQSIARILSTSSVSGQATTNVRPHALYGLAQAQIRAFNINNYANAQARILATSRVSGNARAQIHKSQGIGLALAQIKSGRAKVYGQARASIGNLPTGLAQAYILRPGNGQAMADIKAKQFVIGQAMATMYAWKFSAQAHATINRAYQNSAQALTILNTGLKTANASAIIRRTFTTSGQTQVRIKQVYQVYGQAHAKIFIRYKPTAQARAVIVTANYQIAQVQAQIGNFKLIGQARAKILSYNVPKSGNAQGYILGSLYIPSDPTSGATTYIARFNNYDIPGYVQTELMDSIMTIKEYFGAYMDFKLAEYQGLTNKVIQLKMRVWEPSYDACKAKVSEAATILRSSQGFADLYIQRLDAHYVAFTRKVSMDKDVSSTKILDYSVEFEAKPWLISNTVKTLQGTGTLVTTGRTFNDGTWTPTKITVSGTNVNIVGVTATGKNTGHINIAGSCTNLVIDSENFTLSQYGIMNTKDFAMYVGPGVTTFTITGATDCKIEYNNRWLI